MGFRLKVTGGLEEIASDERSAIKVDFDSKPASDSNARATDYSLSMKIWGEMLYKLEDEGSDPMLGLVQWSQVPSEKAECYRGVEIIVVSVSQIVRQFKLPNAFVMEYMEEVDDEAGVGIFYTHVKQKRDENVAVSIEGGFGGEQRKKESVMSYKITIKGTESLEVVKGCIRKVTFTTDIPLDANARAKDVGSTLTTTGRVLTAVDGDLFDSTRRMAIWSSIPAEKPDCYRKVTVEHMATGVTERKYYFPGAFVVNYEEDFGDAEGIGTFMLAIEQKKDKPGLITIEGGYPVA